MTSDRRRGCRSEADWPSRTETAVYGLPNAGNGTLVVAGTEAPLWGQLTEMVAERCRAP